MCTTRVQERVWRALKEKLRNEQQQRRQQQRQQNACEHTLRDDIIYDAVGLCTRILYNARIHTYFFFILSHMAIVGGSWCAYGGGSTLCIFIVDDNFSLKSAFAAFAFMWFGMAEIRQWNVLSHFSATCVLPGSLLMYVMGAFSSEKKNCIIKSRSPEESPINSGRTRRASDPQDNIWITGSRQHKRTTCTHLPKSILQSIFIHLFRPSRIRIRTVMACPIRRVASFKPIVWSCCATSPTCWVARFRRSSSFRCWVTRTARATRLRTSANCGAIGCHRRHCRHSRKVLCAEVSQTHTLTLSGNTILHCYACRH